MFRATLLVAVVVIAGSATAVQSGHHGCSRCGCGQVRKICVPVCETVKETTYEYSCVCEDFCVPGPSKCVGTRCEPDCTGCPQCVKVWQPTCGHVHTRTKLVKTPVTKEKCVWKWVVKTVCCGCGHSCGCGMGCTDGCCDGCTACTSGGEPPVGAEPGALPPPPPPQPMAEPTDAAALPSLLFR